MLMNEGEFISHQISNKRKSEKESILSSVCSSFWCAAIHYSKKLYDVLCYAVFCRYVLYIYIYIYILHIQMLDMCAP